MKYREISKIQLWADGDIIPLSKYTNKKDSIVVVFEDTNEVFINWELNKVFVYEGKLAKLL